MEKKGSLFCQHNRRGKSCFFSVSSQFELAFFITWNWPSSGKKRFLCTLVFLKKSLIGKKIINILCQPEIEH